MLQRRSTKSKSDLQHRKSTSSVRSVPLEHINVAAAQRDAKLAALQAFYRGQDRRTADMTMFPPQQACPYKKENTSLVHISRHRSVSSLNSEHNRQILDRRQSVRFVAPEYGLLTSGSKISIRAVAPARDLANQHRPLQKSKSVQDVDMLSRSYGDIPLSERTSSRGKTMPAYTQTLPPDAQHYTPEDDIASQPSSYRRIRKSKSMLTPRYHSRNGYGRGTERSGSGVLLPEETKQILPPSVWPRLSFLHRKSSERSLSTRATKARKSISLVKSRRDHASTVTATHATARHNPTNLPCSPLPESSTRSRLLTKPSALFAYKDTKTEQTGRRTLRRGSSHGIPHISETTINIPLSLHGSMRAKARKASSSIKTRFKNLFVNKSEDDATLPAQQIVAQRTHLSVAASNHLEPGVSGLRAFHKRSSLSRILPRIPSLTAVPSNELLRSRKGSIESSKSINRSFSEDRSRVTSWASTEANTVVAHKSLEHPEEHERQRLSVISENGLLAVSSCVGPSTSYSELSENPPLAPDGWGEPASGRPVMDSQRVYSALMKRMNDTRQITDLVTQQRKSSDDSDPFRTLSPPISDNSSGNRTSPETIHVHTCPGNSAASHLSSDARETSCSVLSNAGSGSHRPLSPPVHLNPKGADLPPAVPLTDRSSAFFGSPTSHLFRTRSPWRRSLQEAIDRERASSPEPLADSTSAAGILSVTEVDDKKVDSASTYSQESQIHKPELHQEFPVARGGVYPTYGNEDEGMSLDVPTQRRTGERLTSTASSIDWKTRLSHDVAREGRTSLPPTRVTGRASEVEYVVPTMPKAFGYGHVREEAQIENYDEDEGNTNPAVRLPTTRTTPLGVVEPNTPKLTPQQRSVMQSTPPPVPVWHETNSSNLNEPQTPA